MQRESCRDKTGQVFPSVLCFIAGCQEHLQPFPTSSRPSLPKLPTILLSFSLPSIFLRPPILHRKASVPLLPPPFPLDHPLSGATLVDQYREAVGWSPCLRHSGEMSGILVTHRHINLHSQTLIQMGFLMASIIIYIGICTYQFC